MIKLPPNQQPFDSNDKPNPMWAEFMSEVYRYLNALCGSGTTANRPTKYLFVGRPYFDTTLGQPVWYGGAGWVDSQGNTV